MRLRISTLLLVPVGRERGAGYRGFWCINMETL